MPKKSDEARPATQMVGLQLRFQERLRSQLEQAAKAAGTSLNSDIVSRLERSLEDDEHAGGIKAKWLLQEIAGLFRRADDLAGQSWREDFRAYGAAKALLSKWMIDQRPAPLNHMEVEAALGVFEAQQARLDGALETLRQAGVIKKITREGVLAGISARRSTPVSSATRQGLIGSTGRAASAPPSSLAELLEAQINPVAQSETLASEEDRKREAEIRSTLLQAGYDLAVASIDPATWNLDVSEAELRVIVSLLDVIAAWSEAARKAWKNYLATRATDIAEEEAGRQLAARSLPEADI